jgi:hypothetical protein
VENRVLKNIKTALLLATGLLVAAGPVSAMQLLVTKVDKNADGSMTYHFSVKLDQGETLTPGQPTATGDFVTVYNFYGMIDGSVKSPAGWEFSSETFGRTPSLNGYPMVLPLDVPNTPNLTWTVTKPVAAGAQIDGFAATTHVGTIVEGEYSAQTTRELPAIQGAGAAGFAAKTSQQAVLGRIPTPSFLAEVK